MRTGLVSRASGARALTRAERDTDLGLARDRRVNARMSGKPDLRGPSSRIAKRHPLVSPLGPGSRCARPGHESWGRARAREIAARAADRWPSFPIHNVKQRSVVRSRGALLRPGLCVSSQVPSLSLPPASPWGFGASGRRDSSNSVPPMRGGWSADRRTL
jgi:hypothetical protein